MTESEASKKSTVTAEGVSPSGEAALLRPQGDYIFFKDYLTRRDETRNAVWREDWKTGERGLQKIDCNRRGRQPERRGGSPAAAGRFFGE